MNEVGRNAQKSVGHGEKLPRLKERAIASLMVNGTITKAASEIGLHESTLRRWLAEPEFAKAYEHARGRILESTGTLLRTKALAAVFVLSGIMESTRSKSMVRVSAARAVLEFCYRSVEQDELREIHRLIEGLESKLGGKK